MSYRDREDACRICGNPNGPEKRFYCSPRCKDVARHDGVRLRRTGTMSSRIWMGRQLARAFGDPDAFLALVAKFTTRVGDCWQWNGNMNMKGYPMMRADGRTEYAHRIIWQIVNGRLTHQTIHHACANRWCVNPEHLQEATQRENTAEMYARKAYEQEIRHLRARVAELEANLSTEVAS